MYDVLFIDDRFEEIQDTFLSLKNNHVRCYYSNGDHNSMPDAKEKLLFKNLKYICLDYFLENRGITEATANNKNAVSTLAGVVKQFTDNFTTMQIIVNSSHIKDFEKHEQDFKSYLGSETIQVRKEPKDTKKFSTLHEREVQQIILDASIIQSLRNIVIREAITIENIIWKKIKDVDKNLPDLLTVLPTKNNPSFSAKINLLGHYCNISDSLKKKLNALRELRNELAHEESPNIPEYVTLFCKKFDKSFIYDVRAILKIFSFHLDELQNEISDL